VVFAPATGIPVILFARAIAYILSGMGKLYKRIKSFEIWFRQLVAVLFTGIRVYNFIAVWF
jgi:cytochrome c-type biogenesis protein